MTTASTVPAGPSPTPSCCAGYCAVLACGVKLACHRAHRGKTTTRYYLCPHRDPWRAGGADRRCPERRVRADELDAFVFDQIRQLLARPDLLAAGETALAEQTPAADDELLAAQLDRLERRLQTTRSERGRIADLYQAGVIDSTEMRRRSAEIETRSRRFDQERQALIARQTELATDNRLHQHITGFAQQALAGIDTLDFEGRQQLMRLMLEDVRVRGWQVELRLRIPLDTNPPTSPASDKPKRTRARSPRGSRPAKEAVSSNDRLRSIGESPQEGPERRRRHHPVRRAPAVVAPARNMSASSMQLRTGHHGVHERRDPTSREGMNIDQLLGEDFETERLAQHTDESETGVGHRVVIVEHHRQARRAVRKWHRKGAFLIWRIVSLASSILPDHGTFFADGQALKTYLDGGSRLEDATLVPATGAGAIRPPPADPSLHAPSHREGLVLHGLPELQATLAPPSDRVRAWRETGRLSHLGGAYVQESVNFRSGFTRPQRRRR